MIKLICDNCGDEYEIYRQLINMRKKRNSPNYCKQCMKDWSDEKQRRNWKNKSDEEKEAFSKKMSIVRKEYEKNKHTSRKITTKV